ncbi:MAG TPA: tRNA (adenosine(37)-N6)-threonylcarbamoyltransferase complex dimerization subunit type 1 TsaB [Candidatus Sulfotelmatobacter sp.]|nr:tRNA (adenosine(37)-N6)-threonylcarbamoyltransferase complex dimerization subunit type 1 TsaB [Candidatus Sulfotelmatobacter sp.]
MGKIIKIDTADNKKIVVSLNIDGKTYESFSESTLLKSEACLPLIDNLLNKNKVNLKDLSEIYVNEGPGSFTGLRVGVAIANCLSYLLKIPVNGREIGELAVPVYNG